MGTGVLCCHHHKTARLDAELGSAGSGSAAFEPGAGLGAGLGSGVGAGLGSGVGAGLGSGVETASSAHAEGAQASAAPANTIRSRHDQRNITPELTEPC